MSHQVAAAGLKADHSHRLESVSVSSTLRQLLIRGSERSSDGEGDCEDRARGAVLEFSAASDVLHGVNGPELNSSIMHQLNKQGKVFVCGLRSQGAISATSLLQKADRYGNEV